MFRLLATIIVVFLFSGCSGLSATNDLIGRPAPLVNFYPLSGSVESTANYKGKVLVLAFWDAACRHCRAEMPKLNIIAEALNGDTNVIFLAINLNENSELRFVEQTIEEFNLHAIKQSFSGNGTLDQAFISFNGYLVPYFVLVGKDGVINWAGHSASDLKEPLLAALR